MGKKRSRAKQVSAGITHSNPTPPQRHYVENIEVSMARVQNPLEALMRGKNVVLTIENPNKNETNKRFIKVSQLNIGKVDLEQNESRRIPSRSRT